jgi:hypothetical protein
MTPAANEQPLALTDPRMTALGLAAHGRLVSIEDGPRLLTFHVAGVPADFPTRVLKGDVLVNARDVLVSLELVMGAVARWKQQQARR